jgi:hypothetical protein
MILRRNGVNIRPDHFLHFFSKGVKLFSAGGAQTYLRPSGAAGKRRHIP